MDLNDILTDLAGRIDDGIGRVCTDLDQKTAEWQPGAGANTICWLVWHIGRCIDLQLHDLIGGDQLWTAEWKQRLQLPLTADELGAGEMGYGQSPENAAKVIAPIAELEAYAKACCTELREHFAAVEAAALDRVVDSSYDPPVTAGVRLISVVTDCQLHLGAAMYLKGLHG